MKMMFENKRKLTEDASSAESRINEDNASAIAKIKEYIKVQMHDWDIAMAWNDYCDMTGRNSNFIFNLSDSDINNLFETPSEAFRAALMGDVDYNHNCFIFDSNGNMKSGYAEDFIDIDELASYCVENDEDFGDDVIRGILDENE